MAEQDKNLRERTNEEETGSLPEKELRVMIVKRTQDPRKRMEACIKKIQEMFNKDLEELNGNPLQYSCLENSMDWGAWLVTVHGAAKSRKRLSDFPGYRPEKLKNKQTYEQYNNWNEKYTRRNQY